LPQGESLVPQQIFFFQALPSRSHLSSIAGVAHFFKNCSQAKLRSHKAPVLAIEIESGVSEEMVKVIFSYMKLLACDSRVIKGLIVLNDPPFPTQLFIPGNK